MSDGPQPASAAMNEATAKWYAEHTGGQLQMAVDEDGSWYLCLSAAASGAGTGAQPSRGTQTDSPQPWGCLVPGTG